MKTSIFTKIRNTWKSMSTKDRIGLILDVVCSIGGGFAAATVGKALTNGSGKIEKICVRTMMAGAGIVVGDKASEALKRDYGDPIGNAIDRAKERAAQQEKEAVAHE